MSNKVTVHTGQSEKMEFTSQKGRQVVKYRQKAYVHIDGKPYPVEFNIDTWPDRETGVVAPPLAPGEYIAINKVVGVTRFGEPVTRMEFKPVSAASKDEATPPSLKATGTR